MLCVAAGTMVLSLAVTGFTLDWTHSVERVRWWERWQVGQDGLAPVAARLKGSGAGMEPPPDATFRDGAWWFTPQVPPQRQVLLGASGATGGAWQLCTDGTCHDLPEDRGPLRLWSADTCNGGSDDPQPDQPGHRADDGNAGQPDAHEPAQPGQPLPHQ